MIVNVKVIMVQSTLVSSAIVIKYVSGISSDGKDIIKSQKFNSIRKDMTDKEDLASEDIAAAMDVIIAKNAFVAKGGKLTEKYNAQIITRSVDDIQIA